MFRQSERECRIILNYPCRYPSQPAERHEIETELPLPTYPDVELLRQIAATNVGSGRASDRRHARAGRQESALFGLTAAGAPSALAEAVYEDVGEAQRCLSPIGGVVDIVGHANQRAKKVFRRDIRAYLASLGGAVEQRT